MTHKEFVATATGYYQRAAIRRGGNFWYPADYWFALVQAGIAAVIPGRQRAKSPGWYAACLLGHKAAARRIK